MSLKNFSKLQSALFISVIIALYLVVYTPIDVLQKITLLAFLVVLLFLITLSNSAIEYGIEKEDT